MRSVSLDDSSRAATNHQTDREMDRQKDHTGRLKHSLVSCDGFQFLFERVEPRKLGGSSTTSRHDELSLINCSDLS